MGLLACESYSVYVSLPLKWINDNSQSRSLDGSEQKWSYQVTAEIWSGLFVPMLQQSPQVFHGKLPFYG